MSCLFLVLGTVRDVFAESTKPALESSHSKNGQGDPDGSHWKILFDGSSTKAFRGWNNEEFPSKGWVIEDGCLKCKKSNGRPNGGGGDIVTKESFSDFELRWEWRITPGGNSGVKYMVRKRNRFQQGQELFRGDDGKPLIGHEYQMLDDLNHPDAQNGPDRLTASFYQILPAKDGKTVLTGQFNRSKILVHGNLVEHWLNDVKVLEYELGSQEILDAVGDSKYRFIERFGEKFEAPILFQDHGDEVWLRDIRIRPIVKYHSEITDNQ